jgi:hypothetical protein
MFFSLLLLVLSSFAFASERRKGFENFQSKGYAAFNKKSSSLDERFASIEIRGRREEKLTEKLTEKLSEKLYVDGLNIMDYLADKNGDPWDFSGLEQNVETFKKAVYNAGYKDLIIFLDASRTSLDALSEFQKRVEVKIRNRVLGFPDKMKTLLADAFKAAGVQVRFSSGVDNDDLLASFAQYDGADILSADRDFFRYVGRTYKVFKSYSILRSVRGPRIQLHISNGYSSKGSLEFLPISTLNSSFVTFNSAMADIKDNFYLSKNASPLIATIEDPIMTVRPLRAALYARLGVNGSVTEVLPVWDKRYERVVWTNDKVEPDSKYDYLLDDCDAAIEEFFPNYNQVGKFLGSGWRHHVFGIHSATFNLCVLASNGKISLLELLKAKAKTLFNNTL